MAQLENRAGRRLVAGIPLFWLLLFFLIPFIIVLKISFSEVRLAMPPFAPLFQWIQGWPRPKLHLGNYGFLFTDPLYISSYLYSLKVAAVSTCCCLLIGYPMAYAIAHASPTWRTVLLMMIVLPFWTSFLLRVYAWIGLLKNNGVINNILMYFGIIHEPLPLLQSDFAVYIGIVYSYLPFMILPLYATLTKIDPALLEAANDLGSSPRQAFWLVTFPLSLPGVGAGVLLCFIPIVGEFVIPDLLAGSDSLMIGQTLWLEFFTNKDWPVASAAAVVLLLALLLLPLLFYDRLQRRQLEGGR